MIVIYLPTTFNSTNFRQLVILKKKICLGGLSADSSTDFFRYTGKIYHFSVDY